MELNDDKRSFTSTVIIMYNVNYNNTGIIELKFTFNSNTSLRSEVL